MKMTTLCYLERDGKYLMLHRTTKENDENSGKWIGVGGKFEAGESPEDCAIREVREETGLELDSLKFRGIVTFVSDEWGTEYMHLFTSTGFHGELLSHCSEGTLKWVDKSQVPTLSLWAGDRIFLKLLDERDEFFSLKLCYHGDELISATVDGKPCKI